jgi:hypothetical protein
MVASNLSLALCEFHHKDIHGLNNSSSKDINNHYIASYVIDPYDFINDPEDCNRLSKMMRSSYKKNSYDNHDAIRNYKIIVKRPEYYNIQLVELNYLQPGNECVAFIKTHLIVRLQRRWRKFALHRQKNLNKRKSYNSISSRETSGRWN